MMCTSWIRGVRWRHIEWQSEIIPTAPPSRPVNPIVTIPIFFAVSRALTTLTEAPLVLNPQAMSPSWPRARICLEKISEKS